MVGMVEIVGRNVDRKTVLISKLDLTRVEFGHGLMCIRETAPTPIRFNDIAKLVRVDKIANPWQVSRLIVPPNCTLWLIHDGTQQFRMRLNTNRRLAALKRFANWRIR